MPCRTECDICGKCDCICSFNKEHKENIFLSGSLCYALDIIENNNLLHFIDKSIIDWWNNHTKLESARIKNEALAKLSEREKRVLGLK